MQGFGQQLLKTSDSLNIIPFWQQDQCSQLAVKSESCPWQASLERKQLHLPALPTEVTASTARLCRQQLARPVTGSHRSGDKSGYCSHHTAGTAQLPLLSMTSWRLSTIPRPLRKTLGNKSIHTAPRMDGHHISIHPSTPFYCQAHFFFLLL